MTIGSAVRDDDSSPSKSTPSRQGLNTVLKLLHVYQRAAHSKPREVELTRGLVADPASPWQRPLVSSTASRHTLRYLVCLGKHSSCQGTQVCTTLTTIYLGRRF